MDKIKIIKNSDQSRAMIFSGNKLIGAVNLKNLETFVKDEKLNLIDFENIKSE